MSTTYEQLQAIGKSRADSIASMVAALECDYGRLEELESLMETGDASYAEIAERAKLREAAGDCESREDAGERIQEDPLSIEMRSDWETVDVWQGADSGRGHGRVAPAEFMILLSTGGPATRIVGELRDGEPIRAYIQAQDWGTPWTDCLGVIDQGTLLTYCQQFYFGEG
jgi:hypothetical protein